MHARESTIVIVGYKSAHLLPARLAAYGEGPLVFVDNASGDGSAEQVEALAPNATVIRNAQNVGYGRAANQAIADVETEMALLLNPDVEMDESQILALETEARRLSGDWLVLVPNTGMPPDGAAPVRDGLERVESVSGAAMLFSVARFRALGGFDPAIFLFFEETDLCRRAEAAGLGQYALPGLQVAHPLGTSAPASREGDYLRKWHYQWSKLYFARKHRLWGRLLTSVFSNLVSASWKLRQLDPASPHFIRCHARRSATLHFLAGRGAFAASGDPVQPPMDLLRASGAAEKV